MSALQTGECPVRQATCPRAARTVPNGVQARCERLGTGIAEFSLHRLLPNMRITYVTETFPPEINGVSLSAERAMRHLQRVGHQVQLVRPRQRGEAALHTAAEWRTAGGPIPLYPELRFGLARAAAFVEQWRADAGALLPDLVHVATPGPLAWAALRAARAQGIATSADFRTNFHAYSRHYGLGWLEPLVLGSLRRLHAMADINFVPTPTLARQLRAQGFERLQVVGRGVDMDRFSPAQRDPALRSAWNAEPGDAVLLHVGRLAPEKNVQLALDSFEQLRAQRRAQYRTHHRSQRPDGGLRMVVVGDGPLRQRLQRRHPDVVFAGMQTGQALARHYASADVFLFPSLTDTFGNVTLEALASGLAVVAFDTAAAALHIQDGISGCLAPVPGLAASGSGSGSVSAGTSGPVQSAAAAEAFGRAAARALEHAALSSPLRQRAVQSARRADWDTVLRSFDAALQAVANTARQADWHAAVA